MPVLYYKNVFSVSRHDCERLNTETLIMLLQDISIEQVKLSMMKRDKTDQYRELNNYAIILMGIERKRKNRNRIRSKIMIENSRRIGLKNIYFKNVESEFQTTHSVCSECSYYSTRESTYTRKDSESN